jgi:L1 cell adhesion molecule like protein
MDLFNECTKTVENCLTDSKLDVSDIDDVVLVGGSSRIPKVQDLMRDFFKRKDLCKSINPDEAVAYGAAVQAAILSKGFKNVPNLVLRDVTPLSLGILSNLDNVMSVVIPRNTSIPVKMTGKFVTSEDNQRKAELKVYEGERARAEDNNLLGSFILSCCPDAPRGSRIDVCFFINENGILTVSAKEISTGNTNEITITNEKQRLSTCEIKKMIEDAKRYRAEDTKFLRMAKVSNELEDCVYNMKKFLKRKDVSSMISLKESEKINNAIIVATNLLYMNIKEKKINALKSQLKELEKMLKHLKVKAGIEKEQKFSFLRSLFM